MTTPADFAYSQLAVLADPATGDYVSVLDVSDTVTSPAGPAGSDKRSLVANVVAAAVQPAYGRQSVAFPVDKYGADPTGAADSTTAASQALSAAQAARAAGSPHAFVDFGTGTYKLTAGSLDTLSAHIGFRAQGAGATTILASGSGPVFARTDPDGANSALTRAAPITGMTIDGTACGSGSWGIKDTEVAHAWYQDLVIKNFSAASSGGLWQLLTATWSEKCVGISLFFQNCGVGHLQDGGTSTLPSFDYCEWIAVALETHDNQVGRRVNNKAQVKGGSYRCIVNAHTTASNTASYVWDIGNTGSGDSASVSGGHIEITGEVDGTGGAPMDFNLGSSASLGGEGTVNLTGFTANSNMQFANAKIIGSVASASLNRPLLQVPGTSLGVFISSHFGTFGVQVAGPGSGTGVTFYSGTGAPAISANLGDVYYRTDTPAVPGSRTYVCTTAGSATTGAWTAAGGTGRVATTGTGGFALTNGTPNILTWTAPSDGQMHQVLCTGQRLVSSALTGGLVRLTMVNPDGTTFDRDMWVAGETNTFPVPVQAPSCFLVQPGSTVTLHQTSAVTAGAATVWAEIWGS